MKTLANTTMNQTIPFQQQREEKKEQRGDRTSQVWARKTKPKSCTRAPTGWLHEVKAYGTRWCAIGNPFWMTRDGWELNPLKYWKTPIETWSLMKMGEKHPFGSLHVTLHSHQVLWHARLLLHFHFAYIGVIFFLFCLVD
jgi:hypothetical protein